MLEELLQQYSREVFTEKKSQRTWNMTPRKVRKIKRRHKYGVIGLILMDNLQDNNKINVIRK